GGKTYRKRSWGGNLDKGLADNDKENTLNETVEEVDEADVKSARAPEVTETPTDETIIIESTPNDEEADGGEGGDSDNETLRRSSRGTVVTNSTDMYTDGDEGSEYSYTESEWTESNVGTDAGSVQGNEVVVYGN
ncbi:USO1-like transporter, partial [Fusarium globosum]